LRRSINVRCWEQSGYCPDLLQCPLLIQSGHWPTFDLDQIQRHRARIIVNDRRSAVDAFAWIVLIILAVSAAPMFFITCSLLCYVAKSRNHPRTMDTHSIGRSD
jgi:hypothetical protein